MTSNITAYSIQLTKYSHFRKRKFILKYGIGCKINCNTENQPIMFSNIINARVIGFGNYNKNNLLLKAGNT
mgnify:CR=1 FL=1|jgi:hypothetical protein